MHLGCWNATKEITDFLEGRGRGRQAADFLQLWAEYQVYIAGITIFRRQITPVISIYRQHR